MGAYLVLAVPRVGRDVDAGQLAQRRHPALHEAQLVRALHERYGRAWGSPSAHHRCHPAPHTAKPGTPWDSPFLRSPPQCHQVFAAPSHLANALSPEPAPDRAGGAFRVPEAPTGLEQEPGPHRKSSTAACTRRRASSWVATNSTCPQAQARTSPRGQVFGILPQNVKGCCSLGK